MRLPPGVSGKDFADAISDFRWRSARMGFTSDEDVDLYRDACAPFWHEAEEPIPSAAVAPDGVEQVQAIVKIANQYKIPLGRFQPARIWDTEDQRRCWGAAWCST